METQPRPEYPRPQFHRSRWTNLNGPWTFTFDPGRSGMERGLARSAGFDQAITVPFCPESSLSGVGHTDFIEAIWYHRRLEIPAEWQGLRVLLHFGGVDYASEIFIDGQPAGRHWGGSVSFQHDITRFVQAGGARRR
jgi:beta-galactosidase/beta-glucuronidase